MTILSALFVFQVSIYNIQIVAGVYLFYFIQKLKFNRLILHKHIFLSCAIFFLVSFVSTVSYSVDTNEYEVRNYLKVIGNLQYLIFAIPFFLNKKLLEKLIVRYSLLLSIFILSLYFYYYVFDYDFLMTGIQSKLWGKDFIPGWPNSTPLPLLYSFILVLNNQKNYSLLILICCGIYLTYSRAALLALFLIGLPWVYLKIKSRARTIHYFVFCFCLILVLVSVLWFGLGLVEKIYFGDRIEIISEFSKLFLQRPWLGYGGNTFEQLRGSTLGISETFHHPHTHNWILEVLLRYGLVGGAFFFILLFTIFRKINDIFIKYLFFVFLILALFQTFMQEFIFIFILYLLVNMSTSVTKEIHG